SKRGVIARILGVLTLCAAVTVGTVFAFPKKENDADAADAIGSLTLSDYETRTDGKIFDGDELKKVLKALNGGTEATIADIEALSAKNSADIRSGNDGQNLTVTIAGKTWYAVYLANVGGKAVLTLWQTNVEFSAPYANYLNTAFTSTYPCSMYGMSKMRAAELNNGGLYATTDDSTDVWAQSSTHTYAKFTVSTVAGSLTNYILTPAEVPWQATVSNKLHNSAPVNLNNDSYANMPNMPDSTGVGNNYQSKSGYSNWQGDKIWLAAQAEMGAQGGPYGFWQTDSIMQQGSYWMRTAATGTSVANVHMQNASGKGANESYGVRAAFHLNLSKAVDDAAYWVDPADVSVEYNGQTQTIEGLPLTAVNGGTTLPDWYSLDAVKKITYSYVEDGTTYSDVSPIDARSYTANIALNDDYFFKGSAPTVRDKNVTFKITKKKVAMMSPDVDSNGDPNPDVPIAMQDTSLPYANDLEADGVTYKATAPEFGLQYKSASGSTWSTTKPTAAGTYYARPYIKNPNTCNYEIDYTTNCETQFTKTKTPIAIPKFTNSTLAASAISGTTTTVEYSGGWQEFDLINDTANNALTGVTVSGRSGNLTFQSGKYRVRAVGTYTATLQLADGGQATQWADAATDTSATRTVTIKVEKKKLTVTFDDDTTTQWQSGAKDNVKATVSGIVDDGNGAYENVQLKVTSTKQGGTPIVVPSSDIVQNDADIDVTVDLDGYEADKSYTVSVELAAGNTVNLNYEIDVNASSFNFFILKAVISSLTINWQYENVKTGTTTFTSGSAVNYNGEAYTFTLDDTVLPTGVSVTYANNSATNVGTSYDGTATITADTNYELDPGLQNVYHCLWIINPMEFDVSTLKWKADPTYTGLQLTIGFENDPAGVLDTYGGWLEAEDGELLFSGYDSATQTGVAQYASIYQLIPKSNNYKLVYYGGVIPAAAPGVDGITVYNAYAVISHVWNIKPIRIESSTRNSDWTSEQKEDKDHDLYSLPVANVMSTYSSVLDVKYYRTSADALSQTNEITNIDDATNGIDVTPGTPKTYYIRLSLKSTAENYELYDTLREMVVSEIIKPFTVGDNRTGVPVDFGPTSYTYNGRPQGQIPTISSVAFAISYTVSMLDPEDGQYKPFGTVNMPLTDFPTDVGHYRISVEFNDSTVADSLRLDPEIHYFTIEKLVLETSGWTLKGGNLAPKENVIGEPYMGGNDYSSLYDYTVYEMINGIRHADAINKDALEYEKDYVAVLTIKDEYKHLVEFADAPIAETEFKFTTEFDPNNRQIVLNEPDYDAKLPYVTGGQKLTIRNWDEIKNYVQSITRQDGVTGEAAFEAEARGTYTVTLVLKTDVNVMWANSGYSDVKVVFEITTRELQRPNLSPIAFSGSKIDIMNYLPEEYAEWVDIEIYDYTANVAGTAAQKDENDNYIILHAGVYSVRFTLKDTVNSIWKAEGNENVGYRIALLDGPTGVIDTTWEIKKAQIKGTWSDDGVFTPENEADKDKYTIKYIDADGNVVLEDDLKDGVTYRAVATLNGELMNDYEFSAELQKSADEAGVTEKEFTSTA
ncbi:MAG: hypothetical protein K2N74_00890, partial [Clostridiales bacterium]|nr:hypothetical protein [Clostridiales bacterium]